MYTSSNEFMHPNESLSSSEDILAAECHNERTSQGLARLLYVISQPILHATKGHLHHRLHFPTLQLLKHVAINRIEQGPSPAVHISTPTCLGSSLCSVP
jgi:hypothetical protein